MATDEEVIRKRLLIEGESGGDDRRIGTLLKMFVKWCDHSGIQDESDSTFEKMISLLSQVEFTMDKKLLNNEMNEKEMNNYELLYQSIEKQISEAHDKIEGCKEDLKEAKRVRKNRQEYDNLARFIQKQPDRKETTRKLSEIDKELDNLTESKEKLETKLEDRRKQFHVLINAIFELQRILAEDENFGTMDISTDSLLGASLVDMDTSDVK